MDQPCDYMSKLRKVFDICDQKKQGYISVEHFADLAKEHFGAERTQEVDDIIGLLDETKNGRIYFDEFVSGIKQILDLRGPNSPEVSSFDSSNLFPPYMGSEETLVAIGDRDSITSSTHDNSELSTFNEYDLMTDEDQCMTSAQSGGHTVHQNGTHTPNHFTPIQGMEEDRVSGLSVPSNDSRGYRSGCEMTSEDEQCYEDYGEGADTSHMTDSNQSPITSPYNSTHNTGRRLTSSALASHLFKVAEPSSGASQPSSCSDDIYDDIDDNISDLNDKVQRLESQLCLLTDKQRTGDEKHIKLREENNFLVERIHVLEETLRDVETRSQNQFHEEQRKHHDHMSRSEKDKSQEIELLTQSLQHIEREYQALKEEAPRLRSEVERLRKENICCEDRLSNVQCNMECMSEENRDLNERVRQQRLDIEQERDVHAQLLDELSRELDELRKYKLLSDTQRNSLQASIQSTNIETNGMKKRDLEMHCINLKQENAVLQEMNDDLHAQVTTLRIQHGRDIVDSSPNMHTSLASELTALPHDELLQTMESLQDRHNKLQTYTDGLITRVMESNPSLLEVSTASRGARDAANKRPS